MDGWETDRQTDRQYYYYYCLGKEEETGEEWRDSVAACFTGPVWGGGNFQWYLFIMMLRACAETPQSKQVTVGVPDDEDRYF